MASIDTEAPPPSLTTLSRMSRTGYLVLLALLGPALAPFIGIFNPMAPVGTTSWRYALYGQLASTQFYWMLLLGLTALIAAAAGQRRILTLVSILAAVFALLLAAGGPLFGLDYLQLAKAVGNPAVFATYKTTAFKIVGMGALGTVGMVCIAVAATLAARAHKTLRPARPTGPAAPIGVGKKS